ncbi:unnamed protein product [Cuscuta campestris]|uniref:Chromo domain-containing protein n=1 Tax=Cuscuta campestris TaxID=132261 RepID=A0A484K7T7_9ASTE|nr:unnamed protein product [Cuscuta campestris]
MTLLPSFVTKIYVNLSDSPLEGLSLTFVFFTTSSLKNLLDTPNDGSKGEGQTRVVNDEGKLAWDDEEAPGTATEGDDEETTGAESYRRGRRTLEVFPTDTNSYHCALIERIFAMARELEAKHNAIVQSVSNRGGSVNPSGSRGFLPVGRTSQGGSVNNAAKPSILGSGPTSSTHSRESTASTPIRLLTRAEKLEKDAKGLCYNCDKKWSRDHKCGRFVLMMGEEEEEVTDEPTEDVEVTADISSLHSMAGVTTPRSLRLTGHMAGGSVEVLIDGGSTHNFVHPQVVERMGLAVETAPPFRVYVGNGDSLHCDQQCKTVAVTLQGTEFVVDLYILRIHGHDVVLGVQWLRLLGRVLHDYDKVTMEFKWRDQPVTLRGDTPVPRPVPLHHLRSLQGRHELEICVEILLIQDSTLEKDISEGKGPPLPPIIEQILAEYQGTDGQTEVTNRAVEQYLRAFVQEKPARWTVLLPWAEYALNTSVHSGLGVTPFEALYGRPPPTFLPYRPGESKVPEVDHVLKERDAMLRRLREHLRAAQQRMTEAANRHRREVQFEVGALVLLKLQPPYRQHSVARRKSQKLAQRYYGPFRVLEHIGQVAYKLELPEGSRIHPVFHVALLRPFYGDVTGVKSLTLPDEFVQGQPLSTPVRLLASRQVLQKGKPVQQYLVEWFDGSRDDATWELAEVLEQHFPHLHLEDRVIPQGVESDTPNDGSKGEGQTRVVNDEGKLAWDDEEAPGTATEGDDEETTGAESYRRGRRVRMAPAWQKDYLLN